jgi:hypothetical protein
MPRQLRAALLLATIAVFVGCVHAPPPWQRVTSPHFELYTDLGPDRYGFVLDRLEETDAALASAFFAKVAPPPRMEVFLFQEGDFEELGGLNPRGGFFLPGPEEGARGALLINDGWVADQIQRVAAHELAHAFIQVAYPRIGVWFDEGLASYLESVSIDERQVRFGSVQVTVAGEAAAGRMLPVAKLFSATAATFHGDWELAHHATAWAMVHFIMHGEGGRLRPRLEAFTAALIRAGNEPGGAQAAWKRLFPDVAWGELDRELLDHVHATFERRVDAVFAAPRTPLPPVPLAVAPASAAHVERVRATIRQRWRHDLR